MLRQDPAVQEQRCSEQTPWGWDGLGMGWRSPEPPPPGTSHVRL